MSKTRIIKIMTVMTIIAAVLGTLSGVSLMANASWTNILSTACTLTCAFIAMVQLLLVKEAYRGFVDPDEEE
ncbi:MAG: hypothetical protein IIW34_07720 [Clostridia bacterium]|nr:hypothetical protein [Clostridia bacterium]MBQ2326662.1 hypothetical protein [Clostridia bacterium]MBQ5814020.1 hypothetical protein [Clostridia bacterium]